MNKRALFTALALLPLFAQAEIKTIKDVLGREVKVDVPVKRAVLAFYYPDYIAVTGADKFKNVIGISREFWEKFNPGSWAMFKQKLPTLQNIADIGNINTGTFSLEKTLALKPDVLILADWQYKVVATHLPRIEAAGIPVVVVDFNAETVARHTRSAEIFGELNGTQARAQKIAAEYARGIADIQKRVARAKQSKPKIYIEFGDKGPSEYSYTFGKDMWGAIADTAGGNNIAAPYVKNWGPVNPEKFLTAKPDVIVISGTENGHKDKPDIMAMSGRCATPPGRICQTQRLGRHSCRQKQTRLRHLPHRLPLAHRFGQRTIYRQNPVSAAVCRHRPKQDLSGLLPQIPARRAGRYILHPIEIAAAKIIGSGRLKIQTAFCMACPRLNCLSNSKPHRSICRYGRETRNSSPASGTWLSCCARQSAWSG